MQWISFLILFISTHLSALELGEKINFRISKILPENIIEVNLSQSEQIKVNEQVKILDEKSFVARALCLKIEANRSFWKVYRVVQPKIFKKKRSFVMKAIPTRDVPWEYFNRPINEYQQVITNFYPDKIEKRERIKSELQTRIYASPLKIQKQNDYSEMHFGIETTKTNIKNKFDILFGLESFRFNATDAITEESYSQTSNRIEFFATNTKVFETINPFFGIDYFTQKQGDLYPYKSQIRVYPFGIEKRIEISKLIPKLSFYYSPILERWEMQNLTGSTITATTDTALRHLFGFTVLIVPNPSIEIENQFKIRPLHQIEEITKIEFDNLDFQNSLTIRYFPSRNFFIDYTNTYSLDRRRDLYSNLDEGNVIHSFNLNYRFRN